MSEVDTYISNFSEDIQERLNAIRTAVKEIAPEATERICMRMPTFDLNGKWFVHYAAFKKHIGFYPDPKGIEAFVDRLAEHKTSKGAVQFAFNKPLPIDLIRDIVKYRYEQQRVTTDQCFLEFDAVIQKAHDDTDTAYIIVPIDIKAQFGKGRLKVHATFDGEPYDGSIVNMGVKTPDGSICYIIGVRKDIRAKIGKQAGDSIRITLCERKD